MTPHGRNVGVLDMRLIRLGLQYSALWTVENHLVGGTAVYYYFFEPPYNSGNVSFQT